MRVKDTFVIRETFQTGHDSGLVVVLDTLVTREPGWLVGCMACIRNVPGDEMQIPIAGAKEHGPVNSLFFRGLDREDVPVGSEITISLPSESKATAATLAS